MAVLLGQTRLFYIASIALVLEKMRVVQHSFPVKLPVKEHVGASTTIPLVLVVLLDLEKVVMSVVEKRTLIMYAIVVLSPSLDQIVVFKSAVSPD